MGYGEKTIEVTIDKKGKVTKLEAKGYEGKECLKATEPLEKALGKVTKRTLKPESVKEPSVAEQLKVGR